MKKIIYIICVSLAVVLSSCEKWLDIEPKSEIKSDTMFETESGFKDALIGVYLLMLDNKVYGKEMTWNFVDVIAQQYKYYSTSSKHYRAALWSYSSTTDVIDGMWKGSYNIIANINNILAYLEKNKGIMREETYSVIKGELLGLRAFIHFDLLRLFGWGDLAKRPEMFNKLSIPYSTQFEKLPAKQYTIAENLKFIKEDLSQSISLLDNYGPYGTIPKDNSYYLPNEDKFFDLGTRKYRFNYWAAVSTMARVLMWEGNNSEAYTYANMFISKGGQTSWISSFNINSNSEAQRDLAFSSEHCFALNHIDFFKSIKSFINPDANNNNINYDLLYQTSANIKSLFNSETSGKTDYRFRRLFNAENKFFDGWSSIKFWEVDDYRYGKSLPLIRKPELSYIAAECLLSFGDDKSRLEAIKIMNTVRKNRGIAPEYDIPDNATAAEINQEIENEYRREFIGEGQLFYYYKRIGAKRMSWTSKDVNDAVYVIPMPSRDVDLGGLVDYKKKN